MEKRKGMWSWGMAMLMALALVFAVAWPGSTVQAAEPIPLKTGWLGEHEAFIAWYAKEKGWDKQAGLALELIPFATGTQLMEGMGKTGWKLAGCGALPALTAALDKDIEIIAVGNDESVATAMYARMGNPVLDERGYNAQYPDVSGSPTTVRGKTILCPQGTSAHYMVTRWLKVLGLTEKDVKIRNVEPDEVLAQFARGEGDLVALWAPYTHEAEQQGLKLVATSGQCGAGQPTLLVADRAFAQSHSNEVAIFLGVYFQSMKALSDTPREKILEEYRVFYREWTGKDLPPQAAAWELAKHPVFELDEQLAMFNPDKGTLHQMLKDIAAFHGGKNRLGSVTDAYLKLIRN